VADDWDALGGGGGPGGPGGGNFGADGAGALSGGVGGGGAPVMFDRFKKKQGTRELG
jgi:hypothetical protein